MRKLLIAMGLLASTGLTGCDLWNKPSPPQPVAVTCQCSPPLRGTVAPAPAAAAQRETHTFAQRHSAHGYSRHEGYAERSVDTYGYSSQSRRYGEGEAEGAYGEAAHSASGGDARAWEDGYGRRHLYAAGEAEFYAGQSRARAAETPARLDPWHGYDGDWD